MLGVSKHPPLTSNRPILSQQWDIFTSRLGGATFTPVEAYLPSLNRQEAGTKTWNRIDSIPASSGCFSGMFKLFCLEIPHLIEKTATDIKGLIIVGLLLIYQEDAENGFYCTEIN